MAVVPAQDKIAMDMYEAAARSRKADGPRHYLGMSEIGKKCSRSLWYGFRGFPAMEIDGRAIMIFRFGDRIESEVVYWLKQAGYMVEGTQTAFNDHNGLFCGHCDGIIHGVTSRAHILEVKSCNDRKFAAFKQSGVKAVYPVYYAQCQCYMGYAGLDRALMVIQNKNTSEIYTERLYFSKDDFQAFRDRAASIISANDIPGPINDAFECKWCNHRIICKTPEAAIMSEQQCGTCFYLKFKTGTCEPWCSHPGHTSKINTWGLSCPDWFYLWGKEMPGKEQHPDKAEI